MKCIRKLVATILAITMSFTSMPLTRANDASFEAYNSQDDTSSDLGDNNDYPTDPSDLPDPPNLGWNTVAGIDPRGTLGFATFSDFSTSNQRPEMLASFWGTAPTIERMGMAGGENLMPVGLTNMNHFRQTSQGNANSSAFFAFNGQRSNTFATNNQQGWNTNAAGGQSIATTSNVGIAVDLLAGAPTDTPWPMVDTVVLYAAYANFLPFAPSTANARGIGQISIESGTTAAFGSAWMGEIVDNSIGLISLENISGEFWRTVGDVVTIEQGNSDRVFVFHLERPMPMRYLRANIEVIVPQGGATNLPSQIAINAFEAYNSHVTYTRPWMMFDYTTDRHNLGSTAPVTLTFRENSFPLDYLTLNGNPLIENTDFVRTYINGLTEIRLTQNLLDHLSTDAHIIRAYFEGYSYIEHVLNVSGVVLQENATRVFEVGTNSPVRFDFILSGADLVGVYANGSLVDPENYLMEGMFFTDGTNRRTDRLNLILSRDFLNSLNETTNTIDIDFEFVFVNGNANITLDHTLTIHPLSLFRQRSFSTFSEFFDYADTPNNSLGMIPGYDFGTDPALANANNLGHAGVGAIFPSNIVAGNASTATVTASSWAGGGAVAMFDGRRFHNIRQTSYMAWQTAAATDHQAPGKVTPFGTAMRLDEDIYIDTIVIYGGRAGLNSFFNAHETNTGQASTIGLGVYTSTNNSDWTSLNFTATPPASSDWSNPIDGNWQAFGAVIPIRGDVPSHEVTERVFVFHSPVPIPARYVKLNVYRANNPRNEAAMLQLQLGYSFEVYNTQQSLVSPNQIQHNLLDTTSPLSTEVILRGGDTSFEIVGLTQFVDYTVSAGAHGNQIVSFTPEFLASVATSAQITVDFVIGGQTFPVQIETFVGREPGFALGQSKYGHYDQTNPHERPSINLLLHDNNRVVSIQREFNGQSHQVAQHDNWILTESWIQVDTEIIEGILVPIYDQAFTLEFTRSFLDSLPVGTHQIRMNFAWGDTILYVDYDLEILRSDGAFLEEYIGTYNVRIPTPISVEFGTYGGYDFYGISGLSEPEDYAVNGNVVTFSSSFLESFSQGVHVLEFLFVRGAHVIILEYTLRIQPGSSIDYSIWELQTQEPDNPTAQVPLFHVYSSERLQSRDYSPWWYGDTEGEWDYFMTSPRGFTSPNAASSRTELRERTPGADQEAWWYHRGYHSMRVEYRVPYVGLISGPGSRTAIGQMKPHAGQIEVFVWDDFNATTLALGGFPHTSDLSGVNIAQDEPFTVTYRMIDSVATMYFNDNETPFFRQNIAGFMDNFYFKAGNYDQNAPRGWPDPDVTNSLVAIRNIEVLHNPVRGRLVDEDGNPHRNMVLTYNLLDAPSQVANVYGRTITGLTTTTDENGYFEIRNIPNGRVSWIGGVAGSVSRTARVEIELPVAEGTSPTLYGSGIGSLVDHTFIIDAVPAHTIDSWRTAYTIVVGIDSDPICEVRVYGQFDDGAVAGAEWRICEDGTLEIDEGFINWSLYQGPWAAYVDEITAVVITGPIIAGTSLRSLFRDFQITEIEGLTYFDTSRTRNMENMFRNANVLAELNLSSFDTANVTNMQRMFTNMRALRELTLGAEFSFMANAGLPVIAQRYEYTGLWQNGEFVFTSAQLMNQFNGQYMAETFVWQTWEANICEVVVRGRFAHQAGGDGIVGASWHLCENGTLEINEGFINWTLYQGPWHAHRNEITHIVITGPIVAGPSLRSLFRDLNYVTEIEGLTYFDTELTTSMQYMFRTSTGITELDLSSFDSTNVTNMHRMFTNMHALEYVNFGEHFIIADNAGLPVRLRP